MEPAAPRDRVAASAEEWRVASTRDGDDQLRLRFAEVEDDTELWEHAVLVTSLDMAQVGARPSDEVLSLAQLYRDRADCENVFDELKNQWGWGGFTTHDLARCRLTARMVALVYNWWNIFVRLAEPDKHLEAITSRPLLLAGIAERTRHGRQTTLRIASTHGNARWAERVLTGVARFLRGLIESCGAVDHSKPDGPASWPTPPDHGCRAANCVRHPASWPRRDAANSHHRVEPPPQKCEATVINCRF